MKRLVRNLLIIALSICLVAGLVEIFIYTKFYFYTTNSNTEVSSIAKGVFKKEHKFIIDSDGDINVVIQKKDYGHMKVECNDIDLKVAIEKIITENNARDCIVIKSDFSGKSRDNIITIIESYYCNGSDSTIDNIKDVIHNIEEGNVDKETVEDIFNTNTLSELIIEMGEAETEKIEKLVKDGIDSSLSKYEDNNAYIIVKKITDKIFVITDIGLEFFIDRFDFLQIKIAKNNSK